MKISNIKYKKLPLAEQISNILIHPLFSGSAIMIFGSNSVSFLNYLNHLIMGRLLGPHFYGEFVSIISLVGLLGVIPLSLNIAIVKYVSSAKSKSDVGEILNWFQKKIIFLSILLTLPLLLITPLIASFLHIDSIFLIVLVIIFFAISVLSLIYKSALQGLLKFKEYVISLLLENGAKLIIGIALVYLGFQVMGAIGSLVISAIVGVFVSRYFVRNYLSVVTKTPKNIKTILLYGLPVGIQAIATTSLYSTDVLLVKHFFSSYDAGIYASLSTLGKIIFFATAPISTVMFPLVSKRQSKGENFQKVFFYSLILTSILTLPAIFVYWQFPNVVIRLLYGSLYLEGSNLLVWFGAFMSLFTLSMLFISFNLSLGRKGVVVLPAVAALFQAVMIWSYHPNILTVVFISIIINALLLISLIIYSKFEGKFWDGRRISHADKAYINNSAGI